MADIKKNYVVSHGYDESARLYLQHWMWKAQLGYDLHPAIQFPQGDNICIADQGCGNGAWVVSLAADLEREKKNITLFGFDIQGDHYPASENLPPNIKLGILDAFAPDLPDEHTGRYDVVHIRAFSSVVKEDKPDLVLKNAYKMLKPGGYIQWDDFNGGSFRAIAPGDDQKSSSVPMAATENLVATSLQSQVAMNLKFGWIGKIGQLFEHHGFEVISNQRMEIKKELRSVMTVSLLMIHEHIARIAVRNGCLIGTDKNWQQVWTDAGADIKQGVSIGMDMIVVVGRKAL